MRNTLILIAALALGLAACSGNSQNSSSSNTPGPVASAVGGAMNAAASAASGAMHAAKNAGAGAMSGMTAMMGSHTVTATLSEENGSKESGKVTLVGAGNKTTVTISLTGESATGKQPAHVHVGPCPNVGAVKYPLSNVVLGKSVTVVAAPLSQLTTGTLAVNVHESTANIGKYVACGNIPKH